MNITTYRALQSSIRHWKRLATGNKGIGEGIGASHCSLCHLFFNQYCNGCPVMQATGRMSCHRTPYRNVQTLYYSHGPASSKFKKAAQKELDFLRSLLRKKK